MDSKTMRTYSLGSLLLAAVLTACPAKPPEVKPPEVSTFSASAASVAKGTRITLSWKVTGATSVSIADGKTAMPLAGVDNALEGSVSVEVQDSTVFVLVAANGSSQKAAASAAVSVMSAPTDVTFGAYPPELGPTETGVLAWSAPAATTVSITPEGGMPLNLGTQVTSGTVQVNPTAASTKYTLNASGTVREVTVKRRPAVADFTLSRLSGRPGDMVTLSWRTTNATAVTVTASGRSMPVATVTAAAMAAMGTAMDTIPSVPQGSVITYTLEARGDGGSTSASVVFVVGNAPAITTFTAPQYARLDAGVLLAWSAINADVAEVSLDGGTAPVFTSTTLAQVTDGGVRIATPSAPTQIFLTVRNTVTGDLARESRVVSPIGEVPAMPTFTAMPSMVTAPGTPVTLTWNAANARRARVLESGELTVAYVEGPAAEMGTVTVYPNAGTTTYTLRVDNTVDAPVVATTSVTVSAPLLLTSYDGGVVFDSATDVALGWTLGAPNASLVGYPHGTVEASATFDDIAMTGTALSFSSPNDAVQYVALAGFETFLNGSRLPERIGVSTNGWIRFTTSTSLSATPTPPTTFPGTSTTNDNTLAPFWTDLELGTGQVLWQIKGTAPKRKLIVQYQNVRIPMQMTSTLTFQVQVSQAGEIAFAYRTMTFTAPTTAPVMGLQATGGVGHVYAGGSSNSGATFYGPKSSPLTGLVAAGMPRRGFLDVGMGLMRVSTITPLRAADIRITEVMFNPHPALAAGQWFEVANLSTTTLDISGWTLTNGTAMQTLPSGVVLPANSLRIFGQADAGTDNDGVATDYVFPSLSLDRQAGTVALVGPGIAARATWGATDAGSLADAGGTVLLGGADAGQSAIYDSSPYLRSVDTGTSPVPTPRACLATTAFGSQTPQQLGSPGGPSTCFVGYAMASIAPKFTDISTTGTPLTFTLSSTSGEPADEGQVTVDVSSAPVLYRRVSSNSLTVSTNGFVIPRAAPTFGSFTGNKSKPSTSAPTGGSVVAVFWDDLDQGVNANGNTYVKRMAMNEDPQNPAPHWIVQWSHTTYFLNLDDLNFQVKWFDDGVIEFHYGNMQWETNANGLSATVWLEDATGLNALVWSANQPRVQPNSALRFTPAN